MITVSIVSHGHGFMLHKLIRSLLSLPEVGKIIVTLNIQEDFSFESNDRVLVVQNISPKGFGENNNAAFQLCDDKYFCIVNPDIRLPENPFPLLVRELISPNVGLVAPRVLNERGAVEDSARHFITPTSILSRHLFGHDDSYGACMTEKPLFVDWVAGMFMLFKASTYIELKGFDRAYFLYVEDADICTRAWLLGYRVMVVPSAIVIHDARRATLKNWKHLKWHATGLLRYFYKYWGRLYKLSQSIKELEL